jgi:hypothetical protein
MHWNISLHQDDNYAEITTSGIADQESSLEMAKTIASVLGQYKVRKMLIDHRNIESVTGKIVDIYSRPKELHDIGVSKPMHIAEIIKREHEEHFKFLELVLTNRGFNFHVFYDKELALAWLQKL